MQWPGDFPEDHACVELLVPGVSTETDFKQILNDKSMEQRLKELQVEMGVSRAGDRPPEGLKWFNLRTNNHCSRPVPTENQDAMDFLRALQQYLRSEEEGKEEVTLQILLNISAQCGVGFPCPPSSSFSSLHPHTSATSSHLVHTVRDDAALEIQEAWDDVRLLLRRHLLDRLSPRNLDQPGPGHVSTLSIPERVQCLQQLFFLYPECEVLAIYQGLRSQSVVALLHSALSSGPGSETGFDRLAVGLRSAVPALTQALTEELHVLSKVAEAHAILGFLNEAYLGTVARQLTSLMEGECETALRDNTTSGKKLKKYSTRSRAATAPKELPEKNRSFSLTAHQLRALTQLACTMLGFERTVKDLVTNMTYIDCTGETPCVKGILKKGRVDSNVATESKKSTSESPHLQTPEAQGLKFEWRSAFRGLVPHMAHCIKVVLDEACAKSLEQEEASHSSGCTFVPLSSTAGHSTPTAGNTHLTEDSPCADSERDTPKMIAKFCGEMVSALDAFLPLALACRESSLLEVRSGFVEACGRAAFSVLGRVQDRALEVPASAPLKDLSALLATCVYVHQRLEHYHARLKDSNAAAAKVPLTLLPIQMYREKVEALREQLTSYCVQVCHICILQDQESHRWADPKPFYEGERCSFAVQMWFYFLCGLRSDLWAVLPPRLAKEVLGQVLSQTLQLLVQRYSTARPSYQRHKQIRFDITAVLLYVGQLMWSVCDSPEALVRPGRPSEAAAGARTTDWSGHIHGLCEKLLTVLVVVTAPLSALKSIFMNNPAKEPEPQQPDSPVVHWLNVINPDLFSEQTIRDCLMGHQAASECQLRLLTSDPGHSPRLLLRMLLDRDCHLPRTLLKHSHICQEHCLETSRESCRVGDDFLVALFHLFSCLNSVPEALTQALEPYLERAQLWEHLYTLADTTRTVPVVIRCVREVVSKSTDTLLSHLASMGLGWQATDEPRGSSLKRDVPDSILARIPKEWNYAPSQARGKDTANKTVISLAVQALSFILASLPSVAASVPLPVRLLFRAAERRLSQHAPRQLRSSGLFLWALLGCLIRGLEDTRAPGQASSGSGVAPDRDRDRDRGAGEPLSLLAECLQAAMGIQQKGVPKPAVHKVLQALEEERPKWTNLQLQTARKLCSDGVCERGSESERVAAAELTEQKISLMLLEVCHKAGGGDYLRQIYHIIRGNEELLKFILSGSTNSPDNPLHLVNFDLCSENQVDPVAFKPLHQFDHIGKKKLEQSALVAWAWDWPRILPAYQGMSQVTFKSLLANRWEMQEGAELSDEEKAAVEELGKAYPVRVSAPQDPAEEDGTPTDQTREENTTI